MTSTEQKESVTMKKTSSTKWDYIISCLGAGYVGGPTMAMIALKCPTVKVIVADINEKQIERWNSDKLPM